MPTRQLSTGTILVDAQMETNETRVVLYVRVASWDQKAARPPAGTQQHLGRETEDCGRAIGSRGEFRPYWTPAALRAQGRRVVVTDPAETTGDLVRATVEVLTAFCARLYGHWVGAEPGAPRADRDPGGPTASSGTAPDSISVMWR